MDIFSEISDVQTGMGNIMGMGTSLFDLKPIIPTAGSTLLDWILRLC